MLTTILDEAVNGWIVTIYRGGKKQQFVYETLQEAQEHLGSVESTYAYGKKKGEYDHVATL